MPRSIRPCGIRFPKMNTAIPAENHSAPGDRTVEHVSSNTHLLLLSNMAATVQAVTATLGERSRKRKVRPRLAALGVPLAITASVLSQPWCLPALVLCAWWWSPRATGSEWIGALARGLVGAEWALAGSIALVAYPHDRLGVGIVWVLGAALLGLCGLGRYTNRGDRDGRLREPGKTHPVRLKHVGAHAVRKRFAMHIVTQRTQGKPSGRKHSS